MNHEINQYLQERQQELNRLNRFHTFVAIALVVFECSIVQIIFQNLFVTLIFAAIPAVMFVAGHMRANNYKNNEETRELTGYRPPSGSATYTQFRMVEIFLGSIISSIKTDKQIHLLIYTSPDKNDQMNNSVFTYEHRGENYIVVPLDLLVFLELSDYSGIFPHEIGHIICDHSTQLGSHKQIEQLLVLHHPIVLSLLLGIITQTIFLPILFGMILIFVGKVFAASYIKHEELTADGAAVMFGYGRELKDGLNRFFEPDSTLKKKILRLISDHPTDSTRVKYIDSLTRK